MLFPVYAKQSPARPERGIAFALKMVTVTRVTM